GRGDSAPDPAPTPRSRSAVELPNARRNARRRLSFGADRAIGRPRAHSWGADLDAPGRRRIPARSGAIDADARQPVGIGDPERSPVPRDCRQERATRTREPAQIAVPREYEPRAPDPAERDPRLCRTAG